MMPSKDKHSIVAGGVSMFLEYLPALFVGILAFAWFIALIRQFAHKLEDVAIWVALMLVVAGVASVFTFLPPSVMWALLIVLVSVSAIALAMLAAQRFIWR
jgi:dolichyl-phosphate-mannose--protein O-mannosyl transferase